MYLEFDSTTKAGMITVASNDRTGVVSIGFKLGDGSHPRIEGLSRRDAKRLLDVLYLVVDEPMITTWEA